MFAPSGSGESNRHRMVPMGITAIVSIAYLGKLVKTFLQRTESRESSPFLLFVFDISPTGVPVGVFFMQPRNRCI